MQKWRMSRFFHRRNPLEIRPQISKFLAKNAFLRPISRQILFHQETRHEKDNFKRPLCKFEHDHTMKRHFYRHHNLDWDQNFLKLKNRFARIFFAKNANFEPQENRVFKSHLASKHKTQKEEKPKKCPHCGD